MPKTSLVLLVLVSFFVFAPSVSCQDSATVEYVGSADLDGNQEVNSQDLILLQQQWKSAGSASFDSVLPQNLNLPNSLHANPRGMDYFYSRADGFGPLIGVDYNTLGCKDCHVQNCASCHQLTNGSYDPKATCLVQCHSRQNLEMNSFKLADVHNNYGMTCTDCHSTEQLHGDGAVHMSMLAPGAPTIHCSDCHVVSATDGVQEHQTHLGNIDCSACHLQTVVTCYNCHFDSEIDGHGKIHYGPQRNYILLLNNDEGKVTAGTYMALYHNQTDTSFVVFAPFHSHSVMAEGRTCGDCHNNPYAQTINSGGSVALAQWTGSAIQHATGVIPVAAGKMQLQFLNLTNPDAAPQDRVWTPTKTTNDGEQFGFCTPLDSTQLSLLATPLSKLNKASNSRIVVKKQP